MFSPCIETPEKWQEQWYQAFAWFSSISNRDLSEVINDRDKCINALAKQPGNEGLQVPIQWTMQNNPDALPLTSDLFRSNRLILKIGDEVDLPELWRKKKSGHQR